MGIKGSLSISFSFHTAGALPVSYTHLLLPAATAAQLMGIYDYYDFLNVIIVFTILEGI